LKKLRLEDKRVKAQEASSTMAGGGGDQRRTLWDFITPRVQGIAYSIAQSNVGANKFEVKLAVIFVVQ